MELGSQTYNVSSKYTGRDSGAIAVYAAPGTNANNDICSLSIVFEVGTDPNMDQTLAYMRYGQATAQILSLIHI